MISSVEAAVFTQPFSPGWDIFDEQLNYNTSNVTWEQPTENPHQLYVSFNLRGATPNRSYQVGVHVFEQNIQQFGQFTSPGIPTVITRQGTSRLTQAFELGVVTTDVNGNGSFQVTVNGLLPATYQLQFNVRQGVGCNIVSPGGTGCPAIFQSPSPFGVTPTTFTVVPEPLTILGAGTAIFFGTTFKRQLANAQKTDKQS